MDATPSPVPDSAAPTVGTPAVDLVIAGGRVIDPVSGLDQLADVATGGGVIVAVGPGLVARYPQARVIDATDMVVTPGLIDLHAHVIPGLGNFCVEPDDAGVNRGVPIVVDGGTSGTATINLAQDWLAASAPRTKVLSLVDPCVLYLATHDFICHKLEIANDTRNLDLDAAAAALELPDIVGFKVRVCHVGDPSVSPFLEGAKSIAGDYPIMVHLGRFPHTPSVSTPTLLDALRPGDIINHAFRGASGAMDAQTGEVVPQFRDAVERGVRLDIGHSATDFRFRDARRLMAAGYRAHTVSTDMNVFNIDRPVVSLPETMSKMLALGVEVPEVIAMTTIEPARSIHRDHEYGSLTVGRSAEVSVMRLVQGEAHLTDGYETVTHTERFVPVGCVRQGEWIQATAGLDPETSLKPAMAHA
ncbi:amidohydrolase/deacetylase family metallohydrolase [soil metagenome]